MANIKISALPAGTAAATDEIPVNQAGITKKVTGLAVSKLAIDDSITDGIIDRAPSQNAVFDAVALRVGGPVSSVDNSIVRFDGTSGKLIQGYASGAPTIGDTGIALFPRQVIIGPTAGSDPTVLVGIADGTTTQTLYYGVSSNVASTPIVPADGIEAGLFQAQMNGTQTASFIAGASFLAFSNTSGLVGEVDGIYALAGTLAGASTDQLAGVAAETYSYGVLVNNAYGVLVAQPYDDSGTSIVNNYGLFVSDQSAVGVTKSFNIYSEGVGSKNYFVGHVLIGPDAVDDPAVTLNVLDTSSNLIQATAINAVVLSAPVDPAASIVGAFLGSQIDGTQTIDYLAGINTVAFSNTSGLTAAIDGLNATVETGVGNSTTTASGITTSVYSFGALVTNAYGINILSAYDDIGNSIDSNYGIYINDQSSVGVTNSYNIYSAGVNSKNYFEGPTGIGNTVPQAKLDVFTDSTADLAIGISNTLLVTPTNPAGSYEGISNYVNVGGGSNQDVNIIYGSTNNLFYHSTGTVSSLRGTYYALSSSFSAGVAGIAAAIYIDSDMHNAANNYGILIKQSSGTNTNNYGIYIEDQSPDGSSLSYNFYSAGAASKNYMGGNLSLHTTTATSYLTLGAGTATAGTAPLKLTSGTNLTTGETGAIEYNGTNLFFTRTGTTRENILVGNSGASAPSTSIGVAIVNYYGSSATNFLGTPNSWASVVISGTTYKIPLYT